MKTRDELRDELVRAFTEVDPIRPAEFMEAKLLDAMETIERVRVLSYSWYLYGTVEHAILSRELDEALGEYC